MMKLIYDVLDIWMCHNNVRCCNTLCFVVR